MNDMAWRLLTHTHTRALVRFGKSDVLCNLPSILMTARRDVDLTADPRRVMANVLPRSDERRCRNLRYSEPDLANSDADSLCFIDAKLRPVGLPVPIMSADDADRCWRIIGTIG